MTERDIEPVAELHADREGTPTRTASARVRSWTTNPARIIVVAEHHARVQAFASAAWLDAPADSDDPGVPGWYLAGVVVAPAARRRGLGAQLTEARLALIGKRSSTAWYFANAGKRASIAMHAGFGFTEHARGPRICGVEFGGGTGILFRLDLREAHGPNRALPTLAGSPLGECGTWQSLAT